MPIRWLIVCPNDGRIKSVKLRTSMAYVDVGEQTKGTEYRCRVRLSGSWIQDEDAMRDILAHEFAHACQDLFTHQGMPTLVPRIDTCHANMAQIGVNGMDPLQGHSIQLNLHSVYGLMKLIIRHENSCDGVYRVDLISANRQLGIGPIMAYWWPNMGVFKYVWGCDMDGCRSIRSDSTKPAPQERCGANGCNGLRIPLRGLTMHPTLVNFVDAVIRYGQKYKFKRHIPEDALEALLGEVFAC